MSLADARAVLVGGGWLGRPNGPSELTPFINAALNMVIGDAVVLTVPTPGDPGDNPAVEINLFKDTLRSRDDVHFLSPGLNGTWPSPREMARAIAEATLITIQGGNFLEFLHLAGPPEVDGTIANLLIEKFLSGEAVFLGSSAGTGCWGASSLSADRDWHHGGGVYTDYTPVAAWNVIPAAICVHYNERLTQGMASGVFRGAEFQAMMNHQPERRLGIGIDTQAALVLTGDGMLHVASRDPYAHVQILQCGSYNSIRNDHLSTRIVRPDSDPIPLSELFSYAG